MVAEKGHDLFRLALPQQAVIDEDAGQVFADGLVDQHGGDRGIDAAGKAAENPALPHLLADRLDRLAAKRRHGPVGFQPGDFVDEIGDQLRAVGRMRRLPGWNWVVKIRRFSSEATAKGAFSLRALTVKPSGRWVTRSPWLIQT